MASIIKTDNIQKVSDDSNIIKKCGSTTTVGSGAGQTIVVCGATVTLGRCGGTVSLASGATQTGFGRTGTVDWCTTAKTSPFTGVSGKGYFINTTSGAVTVTLPSSPSAGAIVSVQDYANTAATNNITVGRGGSKIDGTCIDATIDTNGEAYTLVYVDATQGWKTVNTADKQINTAAYVAASGGTTVTCGDWKIHYFTASGCFSVTNAGNAGGSNKIDYLVIGGGAGGGGSDGGGGGAGGFRESSPAPGTDWTDSPLGNPGGAVPVSVQTYPITIGAGGSAGGNGNNSVFSTITSAAGGTAGSSGGSGGGGNAPGGAAGSGNTPPVSPPQGNNGATGGTGPFGGGGGGGGAGGSGTTPHPSNDIGGTGGAGVGTAIYANPAVGRDAPTPQQPTPLRFYAGAGAGSGPATVGGGGGGSSEGAGGGSRRPGCAPNGDANQVDGRANTGGGGAANAPGGPGSPANQQGAGGSGIVILRYKFQN